MSFDLNGFDRSYPVRQGDTLSQYTAKTFLWMMLGLLVTFGVAAFGYATDLTWTMYYSIPGLHWILLVATLIISVTMATRIEKLSVGTAITLFVVFSALFGMTLSVLMYAYRMTSFILIFLVIFGLLSLFIPGLEMFDRGICLVGIAVFLGYTAYDTQKIKAFYVYYAGRPDMLAKASIFSALQLYLDFLNLFLYLLRFIGNKRN